MIKKIILSLLLFLTIPFSSLAQVPIDYKERVTKGIFISALNNIFISAFILFCFYIIIKFLGQKTSFLVVLKHIISVVIGNVLINFLILRWLFNYIYGWIIDILNLQPSYLYIMNYETIVSNLRLMNNISLRRDIFEVAIMVLYFVITLIILYFLNYWASKRIFNMPKKQAIALGILMGVFANPFIFYPFISSIYYFLIL